MFFIETVGAGLSGILFAVTALWPEWIEALTGLDPDGGSGAVEWALAGAFALTAVSLALVARRHRRLAAP